MLRVPRDTQFHAQGPPWAEPHIKPVKWGLSLMPSCYQTKALSIPPRPGKPSSNGKAPSSRASCSNGKLT